MNVNSFDVHTKPPGKLDMKYNVEKDIGVAKGACPPSASILSFEKFVHVKNSVLLCLVPPPIRISGCANGER